MHPTSECIKGKVNLSVSVLPYSSKDYKLLNKYGVTTLKLSGLGIRITF